MFVVCLSALKRSFEVEEADTSTHPSPLTRRTTNPLRSSTSSTSSQRSYDLSSRNSDYSSTRSSPSESSSLRSPKTGMRRIELSGGRNADTASSRRAEMSIEVSSKQIDSSPSAGITRFGLKRPEVSLSNRSTSLESSSNSFSSTSSRRGELNMTRTHEPPAPPRRIDSQMASTPVSRIPEPPQRRAEPPSPNLSPVDVAFKRPEVPVENNGHQPPAPVTPLPSPAEHRVERVQSPVTEASASRPADSEYLLSWACFPNEPLCMIYRSKLLSEIKQFVSDFFVWKRHHIWFSLVSSAWLFLLNFILQHTHSHVKRRHTAHSPCELVIIDYLNVGQRGWWWESQSFSQDSGYKKRLRQAVEYVGSPWT